MLKKSSGSYKKRLQEIYNRYQNSIIVGRYSTFDINVKSSTIVIDKISLKVANGKVSVDNVPIGRYKIFADGVFTGKYLYVVYNPESELDDTFISIDSMMKQPADKKILRKYKIKNNSQLVDEYLVQKSSFIYKGTRNSFKPLKWNYNQDHFLVLDVMMTLLDNYIRPSKRKGIAEIVRLISNLGNYVDGDDIGGIMVGCWDDRLDDLDDDQFSPNYWRDSLSIFAEFIKNKMRPVEYAQCWVFAGLLTTMLRTLGIPSRTITNFGSAHDSDGDMIIDRSKISADSVWNFHCWVECWMRRDDLGKYKGYGWQAVDSTPQEESDGQYQCGPCPLNAIANDDFKVNYDAQFIRTSVKYKTVDGDEVITKVFCEFNNDGVDITANYILI